MLQLQIRSYPLPMVVECGFGAGQVSLLTYYVVFELNKKSEKFKLSYLISDTFCSNISYPTTNKGVPI